MHFLAGNNPVFLVLLVLVAAFLALRLRSVLGKRTGFERPVQPPAGMRAPGPVIEARAEPVPAGPKRELPDPSSPAGQALVRMRERDRGFEPNAFLDGVDAAFRRIVKAYADGDRAALRQALTADAFAAFDAAITARETAGETQRAEVKAIASLRITEASLADENGFGRASIEVRIVSDQVSMVLDRAGDPISGADAVTELADSWLFERPMDGSRGNDRNGDNFPWRLAAARSA